MFFHSFRTLFVGEVFDHISAEVKGVLESHLSLRDFHFNKQTDRMRITMRSYSFFEPGTLIIKPEMADFFYEMSDILNKKRSGKAFQVQVLVRPTRADAGIGTTTDLFEFAGRRAAIFTRALIARGVDPSILAAVAVAPPKGRSRGEIEMTFDVLTVPEVNELDQAADFIKGLKGIGVPAEVR